MVLNDSVDKVAGNGSSARVIARTHSGTSRDSVDVLTPPAILSVLAAGYRPQSQSVTIPGGSPFTIDLSKMTQVASPFQFTAQVDGNAPSAIDQIGKSKTGAGRR